MNASELLDDAARSGVRVSLIGRDVEFEGSQEWIEARIDDIERLQHEVCLIVRMRESARPVMGKVLQFRRRYVQS